MADDVPITAGTGTNVATDDIGGRHFQRVKVTQGVDGTATDVSSTNPLPTMAPDFTAGPTNITVTDTAGGGAPGGAGALISTAPTAGSFVAIQCPGGDTAWNVQITGLTSGTLYFEGSLNSTNGSDGSWINVNGRQTGIVNTVLSGNATTNGVWRGNTSGLAWFRIRSVGALTGTPAILIRISDGIGAIFMNASIPAGTNLIGMTGDQTDVGRVNRHFIMDNYVAAPVADALMTVTQYYNNALVAGTTTPAVVPAGKRLRLTGARLSTKSLAAAGSVVLRTRFNTAGLAAIGSPIVHTMEVGSVAAVAGLLSENIISFPEGIDLPAAGGIGFSLAGYNATGTLTLQGVTRFEVWGYEYTV